jgi:hypothetical protein
MKSYTDIEQSKKLEEILPLESADRAWYSSYAKDGYSIRMLTDDYPLDIIGEEHDDIPAWSLAALFDVLPTIIGNFFERNALRLRMDKGENDFNIWYENFDCGDVAEGLDVKEGNPIDACVAMILKLHKQKLL